MGTGGDVMVGADCPKSGGGKGSGGGGKGWGRRVTEGT